MSIITAIPLVTDGSDMTTGFFNTRFGIANENFSTLSSGANLSQASNVTIGGFLQLETGLAIGDYPASGQTQAGLTINVNSNQSQHIYFNDSSGQRSSYVLGQHFGFADGLTLYDVSGDTTIFNMSKQSVRFFQTVVGPVFSTVGDFVDVGTIGTAVDSTESRVQAAISTATNSGVSHVLLRRAFLPYSAGSISFDTRARMVREGANWGDFDVQAYGATANGSTNDISAVSAADRLAQTYGAAVHFPPGVYRLASTSSITSPVIMAAGALISTDSNLTTHLAGAFSSVATRAFTGGGKITFGKFTPRLQPEWWGAVGDGNGLGGGTNSKPGIQAAIDAMLIGGGIVSLNGNGYYRIDSGLSLVRSGSQATRLTLEGNGCRIDCSNLTGTDVGLTVGGATIGDFIELGGYDISDIRMLGPEVDTGGGSGAIAKNPLVEPEASVTGINFKYAGQVSGRNLHVNYFKTGIRLQFTFPYNFSVCDVAKNWIGVHIDEAANFGRFDTLDMAECRYGALIRSTTTIDAAGEISNVVFDSPRIETCSVGFEIDTRESGDMVYQNIAINEPYMADVEWDYIRSGLQHTFSTPHIRGSARTGQIYDLRIQGGRWPLSGFSSGATNSVLVLGSNGNTRNVYVNAMLPDNTDVFVNTPLGGQYTLTGANANFGVETRNIIFNNSAVRCAEFNQHEGYFGGQGWVTFVGSTGSLLTSGGNISSVSRLAAADYRVNFTNAYANVNSYAVSPCGGTAATIFGVFLRSVNSVRILARDHAGADLEPDVMSVVVQGRTS